MAHSIHSLWVLWWLPCRETFGMSMTKIPTAMKTRKLFSVEAALLTALLALLGIAAMAAPVSTKEEVIISGQLHADDQTLADAVVVVELGDEACLRSELSANGRFEFKVPVGSKARLIFLKPGYLTKEVEVDTKNALNSEEARKLNKKVKFDVVLEEQLQHMNEVYMGPVGYIHFVNGTGLMRVRHDERMKPVAKPADGEEFAVNP